MMIQKFSPPKGLQQFQREFGKFLRNPEKVSHPEWLPARAGKTYQELIFNNICSFINACFPVCQKIIGSKTWLALIRDFFWTGTTSNPMFTSIPAQFVEYLPNAPAKFALPEWFVELAHYEWIELVVDTDDANVEMSDSSLFNHLEEHLIAYLTGSHHVSLNINPTAHNLQYQWPVHQISADYLPQKKEETFILVLRDSHHKVRFIVANALTAFLVDFLSEPRKEENLLHVFATQIGFTDKAQLQQFIIPLLADFVRQDLFTIREE